jgi:septation ring formation regulator EzrA
MKKQLLILGLLASCGLQVQAEKKVMPRLPQPVDKDLLHVGLELKKAMNSDVFKKQLKTVVAEVFKQANLSPSETAITHKSLARVRQAMQGEYEKFKRQSYHQREASPEMQVIIKELKPINEQLKNLYNNEEYKALRGKAYGLKDVQEYRKQNFDYKADSEKITAQLLTKFPEYKKLQEESEILKKQLEPYNKKKKELYAKLRPVTKHVPQAKPSEEQKAQQELQKELSRWPVREIFKEDDAQVLFEHARLIVSTAVMTLANNLVEGGKAPEQSAEQIKQEMVNAGLKIKQALTADSVKQQIKQMVSLAVDQANISTEPAKKSYNSLMLLSNALQQGVDVLMPSGRASVEQSPEERAIYDELDKLRKEYGPTQNKYYKLMSEAWSMKDVRKERRRLFNELGDQREAELNAKFPEYAKLNDQLKPYQAKIDKISEEQGKLFEKQRELREREQEARQKAAELEKAKPRGNDIVGQEMQRWPFEEIVQIPNDFGIVLEHARLIIEAAGQELQKKAGIQPKKLGQAMLDAITSAVDKKQAESVQAVPSDDEQDPEKATGTQEEDSLSTQGMPDPEPAG